MSNVPKVSSSNPKAKRIAWLTGMLCAACCAIPLIAIVIGSASLAGLALYAEKAVLAVVATGAGILVYLLIARRKAAKALACAVDCGCRSSVDKES